MKKKRKQVKIISDQDLISSIIALADSIKRVPAAYTYLKKGKYSPETVIKRFGSWDKAIEISGVRQIYKPGLFKYSEEEMIEGVRRVAQKLGRMPSATEYQKSGEIPLTTLQRRFGKWKNVIAAAGLTWKDNALRPEIPEADLRRDLERVTTILNRLPQSVDYLKHGKYSLDPFRRRAASNNWRKILKYFLNAADESIDAIYRRPDHDKLDELKAIAKKIGYTPNTQEVEKHKFNPRPLIKKFGSWEQVCKAAGLGKPYSRKMAGRYASEADTILEIRRIEKMLGKFPTKDEFNKNSRINAKTAVKRIGQGKWANIRQLLDKK